MSATKRYYIKYTFDPENKMLTWKSYSEDAGTNPPKYAKVAHVTGRKYCIIYPGRDNTQMKLAAAYTAFKKFYAEKLSKAAKDINNAADALGFFCAETIEDSDGM